MTTDDLKGYIRRMMEDETIMLWNTVAAFAKQWVPTNVALIYSRKREKA